MVKEQITVIRETFGRLVYTHKTYEKAAEICINKSSRVRIINIILLSLTSGSAIGVIFKQEWLTYITPILATLALFVVIYDLSTNFQAQSDVYKRVAKNLWLLKERYQNLIADIKSKQIEDDSIIKKRDNLLDRYNDVVKDAPQTNRKAYKKAQKCLKIEEEHTFTSDEIDAFLPKELRNNK